MLRFDLFPFAANHNPNMVESLVGLAGEGEYYNEWIKGN